MITAGEWTSRLQHGVSGEAYNVGGGNEVRNIDLTHRLLALLDRGPELIKHVADRPGHDWRYSIDTSKLKELGYRPQGSFEHNLADTVDWYRQNPAVVARNQSLHRLSAVHTTLVRESVNNFAC